MCCDDCVFNLNCRCFAMFCVSVRFNQMMLWCCCVGSFHWFWSFGNARDLHNSIWVDIAVADARTIILSIGENNDIHNFYNLHFFELPLPPWIVSPIVSTNLYIFGPRCNFTFGSCEPTTCKSEKQKTNEPWKRHAPKIDRESSNEVFFGFCKVLKFEARRRTFSTSSGHVMYWS